MMREHSRWASMFALMAVVGCYTGLDGSVAGGDGAADGGSADGGDGGTGDPDALCPEPDPGASPIRRLTAWEYDNTIYDLLGDDTNPSQSFLEEGGSGFDNNADVASVTWLMAQKYMLASEGIAERAVTDVDTLLGCDPAMTDESTCVAAWIESFGRRAWRRPLTTEELDAMQALFDDARSRYDLPSSISLVLQAFLQSPHFLYRVELGVPGEQGTAAVALDDWEMASRLSYFLWGSMPDDALFEAAEAGALGTPEEVEAQARRMLDDPRARRMVGHFYEQWLGYRSLDVVEKDAEVFPTWSPAIALRQRDEAAALIEHVMFEDDANLATLLTAPYTFVDAELADFYDISPPGAGGLAKVQPAQAELSGILSLGGILSVHAKANQTNPIARGIFVRQQLLCTIPPPPPDDVDIVPPEPDPDATTREQFEQHRSDPACSGCHMLFDPIGFGFENFDAVGRWRTTQNGFPVDASGELLSTDVDRSFDGVSELGQRLAQSEDVARCVARQWFRFAYGRTESAEQDACTLEQIDVAFDESGHDLRELLVALTQTDAFLYRTAYAAEDGA